MQRRKSGTLRPPRQPSCAADRGRPPDAVDLYVGCQIRLLRKLLGLNQEQLAEQIGVTFQQLQKYEKGINRIGAGRLFRIARILDVEVAVLFPEAAAPQSRSRNAGTMPAAALQSILTSPEAVDLIEAFAHIHDAKVRRGVVTLVMSIANATS